MRIPHPALSYVGGSLDVPFATTLTPDEPPTHDAAGDPLPGGALARIGSERLFHAAGVTVLALSSDSRALLSAGTDGEVRISELPGGRVLTTFQGDEERVVAAAFWPEGDAATTVGRRRVRAWNLLTSRPFREHALPPGARVAISPDGRWCAVAEDALVRVLDLATGRDRAPVEARASRSVWARVEALALSRGGDLLAVATSEAVVRVLDARTGGVFREFPGASVAIAFSPDARRVALGTASDPRGLRVVDLETREEIWFDAAPAEAVAFAPEGLAIGVLTAKHELLVFDADTRKPIGRPRKATAFAFAADGRTFAVADRLGDFGGSVGPISVVERATGAPAFPHALRASALAFARDGSLLVGCTDGSVRFFDAAGSRETRAPLVLHEAAIVAIALAPDGRRIATAAEDDIARITEIATGEPAARIEGTSFNAPRGLAFAPDGTLAIGGTAGFWREAGTDAHPVRLARPPFHAEGRVAVTSDGRIAAFQGEDSAGWVELRHVESRARVRVAGGTRALSVASFDLSPDGHRIALGLRPQAVRIEDLDTGKPLLEIGGAAAPDTPVVAYDASGAWLALAPRSAGAIRIVDAVTGDVRRELAGPRAGVCALASSASPRTLAALAWDGSVVLYPFEPE